MSQEHIPPPATFRRFFAAYYERASRGASEKSFMEPIRKEIVGQAEGLVLEVGAGNGLNFAFYNPEYVERLPSRIALCSAMHARGPKPRMCLLS